MKGLRQLLYRIFFFKALCATHVTVKKTVDALEIKKGFVGRGMYGALFHWNGKVWRGL